MTQKWAYWENMFKILQIGLQLTLQQYSIILTAVTTSPTEASLQLEKPVEFQECKG